MTDRTKIEWTDATWNALRGCSRVSAGCANCYAEAMAGRFSDPGQWGHGIATREPESAERYALRGRWTGKVILDEQALVKPLHWKKPRRIFVTSIGDPFHPQVTDDMLDRLFAVMALTPQHTYQLLTKRPERMREYLGRFRLCGPRMGWVTRDGERPAAYGGNAETIIPDDRWPLPNLWLGVSVEDQAAADERIPHLLATPAAVRFLSCEPLLGPVDLSQWLDKPYCPTHDFAGGFCLQDCGDWRRIDWVIVGGESGPKARPMHPNWARTLRDQCADAGVPFLFKQWGEWSHEPEMPSELREHYDCLGRTAAGDMVRLGKKAAGRHLDGQIHDAFPEVRHG